MIDKLTALALAVVGWTLLIVSLTGCGAGAATTPVASQVPTTLPPTQAAVGASTPAAIDPCKLLSQSEVTAFFGAPSDGGKLNSVDSNASFCMYATADNSGFLAVNLRYESGSALKSDTFALMQSALQNVPNLGEAAYFDSKNGTLSIAKGSWIMSLNASVQGKTALLDKLTPLAQTALGRLS